MRKTLCSLICGSLLILTGISFEDSQFAHAVDGDQCESEPDKDKVDGDKVDGEKRLEKFMRENSPVPSLSWKGLWWKITRRCRKGLKR